MKLIELFEARRNPEQNPKLSLIDVLRKYKDDPDIYITFRSVPHLNINTRYGFNTPMGVYFYPLKAFWNHFSSYFERGELPMRMYATEMRYCFISRYNGKGNKEIRDTNAYTHADRVRDFDELRKLGYDVDNAFSQIPDNQYTQNEFGKFWNTLNVLTQRVRGKNKLGTNLLALEKNKILRRLGYAYVSEPGGSGIIHPNEVEQGFFISAAYIQTINMVDREMGQVQKTIRGGIKAKYAKAFTNLKDWFEDIVDEYNDEAWATIGEFDDYENSTANPLRWADLNITLNPDQDYQKLTIQQKTPSQAVLGYLLITKIKSGQITLKCYDVDDTTELVTVTVPAQQQNDNDEDAIREAMYDVFYSVTKNSKFIMDFSNKVQELRENE